jgi:hypothetical protein
MTEHGYDERRPVDVVRLRQYFFLCDGHRRTSAALRARLDHVPCVLHAPDEETGRAGVTFGEEVRSALQWSHVQEWEAAHGFEFASYGDAEGNPRFD